MRRSVPLALLLTLAAALQAHAQDADGASVYQRACASCHADPAADSRAPRRELLAEFAPEAILTTLTNGKMFRQGSELTDTERRAVAGFIAGRPVGAAAAASTVGRCTAAPPPLTAAALSSGWNGWGGTTGNARYQPAARGGLSAPMVPRLTLKWAFGFPGVNSARSQPTVVGSRLYVASEGGDVYALDAKTGCTYWRYHAKAGIRTAVSVAPYRAAGATRFAVYFADEGANAYGVDADSGREIWTRRVDDHPYAQATGSVTAYDGRVYVPIAGVGEEGQGGNSKYPCCTFRGSVTALDGTTGAVVWKTYSIADAPKPRGTSKDGVTLMGPAGGGIWAAPTVDAKRRMLYVATGNGYADPPQRTTDAVLALDIATGAIRWSSQPVPGDVWAGGCRADVKDNPNCPAALGPDHDFSASPVLATTASGKQLVVIQQKSGMAWAFDPDKNGALLWQYRTSAGGTLGGQWGAAVDDKQAYFSVNGTSSPTPGGIRAVRLDTGQEVWSKPASDKLCGTERGCTAAQGAAVTAIPGIVFSGSMDGGLRAYASDDGSLVWQFNTNRTFDTVNGVKANGGAMDGPGAVVAGGMLYINSGYVSLIGRPGNVLLAFGVE
jgi:polyvinyl alcohol dehydrogenase (cytochrome)